jgi:pyruvate,water dikinase
MMTGVVDDLRWAPPGPGMWFASAEHLPRPVSGLMAELLPRAGAGWRRGTDEYGLPPNTGTFGIVNCWGYYSPGVPGEVDLDRLERRAAESLELPRWRVRLARWHDVQRPQVLAANRALLRTDLAALDDAGLAAHLRATVEHFCELGPQHFESVNDGAAAVGALLHEAPDLALEPSDVVAALAGTSVASSSAERLLDRIAAGLREAGLGAPDDLDEVRALGGSTAAALDELVLDYGWRPFDADVVSPTLAERPDALLAAVRAAVAGWSGGRRGPDGSALDALRDRVPEAQRARFDELAADARVGYGHNDDNTVLLFSVPLGAVRRAVLEVGRRLVACGRALEVDDVFDARSDELVALLGGAGPTADELARRRRFREAMADVAPPPALGEPPPAAAPVEWPPAVRALDAVLDSFRSIAWDRSAAEGRAEVSIGSEVVRGRAVVVVDPTDALARMEPGDVLVALTTSATFNTIFPVAGAVAVQLGSALSHAAVLARELGLTAVIGVPDLLDRIGDGDLVEVDPIAGTIRVVDGS